MENNVRPESMERITTKALADAFIDEQIKDFEEPFSGGKEKLRNALEIMMLAHISSNLKNEADSMLQNFIND